MTREHDAKSTHGLPVRFDSLVGRREEVALIRRLLQSPTRLITITGGAGVGKSRLAVAVAEGLTRSVSGVWHVDVRESGTDVATAVAHRIKVPTEGDPLGAVVRALRKEDALLLLDDADEALPAISPFVDLVLAACPGVRFVATSREPLTSTAQTVVTLDPFRSEDLTATSDAVRLFVDRATAADALFSLDERTLPSVLRICASTGGVPLALELAAAQLQFMDAETLAHRMDDQLETLASAHSPTRSLRTSVQDSWNRCSHAERRVWSDLAVLAAGWDLELGEAMALPGAGGSREAREALRQLIRRSVVHRRRTEDGVRYELLPALREFGAEHAEHAGEARRTFVAAMLTRLHDAEDNWFSSRQPAITRRLRADVPNIRRAVATAAADGSTDDAIELASTASRQAWLIHGSADELTTWLGTALDSGEPSAYWGSVGHAWRAFVFSVTEKPGLARAELRAAAAARDRIPDVDGAVWRDSAAAVLSAEEAADTDDADAVLILQGLMDDLGEEAYRFGRLNSPQRLAARLHALGRWEEGDEVVAAILERGLLVGESFERSFALTARATAKAAAGDLAATDRDARDALVLKRGLDDGVGVAQALELLAEVARERAEPKRGATLLGAASARWREVGAIRMNYPPYFVELAGTERGLRHRLGAESFEKAYAYGAALSEDESIDYALHGVVEAHTRAGVPAAMAASARASVLTPRESQVASYVSDGETNKAIARQLFVSIRTVETHVQNALVKLGLRSRTELAVWYREQSR
ncbi:LuxR C-terminal-related transcriptional regulator [Leifsonia sp. NPDC077715]|uniref:LuxR C-terminal-related transcriptional regulator n=1 Tax=Leifsonia sp. NPDC077715 TaxID=3155539 RepID=UPI00341F0771